MPKINLQAVPKFKPRVRSAAEYGARNVRQDRALRNLEHTPQAFTLHAHLQLELPNGVLKHTTQQSAVFRYSFERMRWENEDLLEWHATIDCHAVALDLYHEALMRPIVRQLMDVQLEPGMTISFQVGNIHVTEDVIASPDYGHYLIPPEDFVIHEEPDAIDWQKQLVKAVTPKKRRGPRFK